MTLTYLCLEPIEFYNINISISHRDSPTSPYLELTKVIQHLRVEVLPGLEISMSKTYRVLWHQRVKIPHRLFDFAKSRNYQGSTVFIKVEIFFDLIKFVNIPNVRQCETLRNRFIVKTTNLRGAYSIFTNLNYVYVKFMWFGINSKYYTLTSLVL